MKKAKDIMNHKLICVSENAQLKKAAEILSSKSLSGVPVVNKKDRIVGFISEKDIIASLFPGTLSIENPEVISLRKLSPLIRNLRRNKNETVKEFMHEPPVYISENASISEVAALMLEKKLLRLPVVGRDRHLCGVIERAALLEICRREGRPL